MWGQQRFNVDVNPSALDHFVFETQPVGPYIAGNGITVRIRAEDASNNLITGFNGTATVSDSTGTVEEGSVGSGDTTIQFVNGIYNNALNPTLFITGAQAGILITVSKGGISNDSVGFEVQPDVLDSFTVEAQGGGAIGAQDTDNAFNIDITAFDQYGNVLDAGPNAVQRHGGHQRHELVDSACGERGLVNGFVTQAVTVTTTQAGDVISVTDTATTTFVGNSNAFNVGPGALSYFFFETEPVGPYIAGTG